MLDHGITIRTIDVASVRQQRSWHHYCTTQASGAGIDVGAVTSHEPGKKSLPDHSELTFLGFQWDFPFFFD